METLFRKVKDCLDRLKIHFTPSIQPSPVLVDILIETLVHIFTVLALATKYCDSAIKSDSRFKQGTRAVFRRTSEFHVYLHRGHNTHHTLAEDCFRVLVDKTGAQAVLDELEMLTESEQLATIASSYATIREGELSFLSRVYLVLIDATVQARVQTVHDQTGMPDKRSSSHSIDLVLFQFMMVSALG